MEFSTFHSDLAGTDIKPNALLGKYLNMLEADAKALAGETMKSVDCPACGSSQKQAYAAKMSFEFAKCGSCATVYVPKRPSQDRLLRFFKDSAARRFWLQDIWKETASVRHEKILEPLKDWVETFLAETGVVGRPLRVVELDAASWGFWETLQENPRLQMRLVEPMFDLSLQPSCEGAVDSLDSAGIYDAVCLIEALGRVENPLATLQWASQHLAKGGLCFITTTLSTGFDVLTLGAASEAMLPPERLSLLSIEGMKILAAKAGLEVVELSTPGVLDLQNVLRGHRAGAEIPPFAKYLVETRAQDPRFTYDFQTFLQSHGLSSQGRAVLRKA